MADDITIKEQEQGSNKQQASAQASASQSAGQTGAASQAGQTGATASVPAASSASAPAGPPAQKKSAGISLEDEAIMAQSQGIAAPPEKYSVPSIVKEKFPDLVQLIKETESMNDQERDYWFQILPIMTEDQIRKFRDILVNEKNQLARLDKEYEDELNRLNEKHMLEWKEFEMKEKRKALQAAESKSKEEEKAAEEELLKRLAT